MAASISLRVRYGASPGSLSSSVIGLDMISADNATNSSGNRAANPITAGQNSYEKYAQLYVDTAPDNYVETFQAWGDGSVDAETTLVCKVTDTYATPATSAMSGSTDWTTYVSGNKLSWHSGQLTAQDEVTDYLAFQLQTTVSASSGDWSRETVNYSYDEA